MSRASPGSRSSLRSRTSGCCPSAVMTGAAHGDILFIYRSASQMDHSLKMPSHTSKVRGESSLAIVGSDVLSYSEMVQPIVNFYD